MKTTNLKKSGRMIVHKRLVSSLSEAERNTMYTIYSAAYTNTTRATFDQDLAGKKFTFLGFDSGSDEIVGFSTLEIQTLRFQNRTITYFFSGDTMILPQYWGQKSLHGAFAKSAALFKLTHPQHEVYWYLICMGYRTYMTMAKNFPTYYPRFDKEMPESTKALLDLISTQRYGNLYNPKTGLIIPAEKTALADTVAPIDEEVLRIPEAAFLVKMNPGYEEGHEMACLGLMDMNMLTYFGRKWANKFIETNLQSFNLLMKDGEDTKNAK